MSIENMKILSIDDNPTNLFIIENFAKQLGVSVTSFSDPKKALDELPNMQGDLLIVDYMMPEIDGLMFIEAFRKNEKAVPIIMLTAAGDDVDLQVKALELGANDFLSKPINAPIFKARIMNMLNLRLSQQLLRNKALLLQEEVKKATKELIESEKETLQTLGKVAEFRDPDTNEHTLRVASYSKLLASKCGLDEEFQDLIFYASTFHDIGKVGIADAILQKPAKLTDEEYSIMKEHSVIGYEILKNSCSAYLKMGADISLAHHEKYDGTGYPNGLRGNEIPIEGRIVAIVDVFDALVSSRPYKKPWSIEKITEYFKEQKGKHFDPILTDMFLESIDEMEQIAIKYKDKEEDL